jgi:hypothetical protein
VDCTTPSALRPALAPGGVHLAALMKNGSLLMLRVN